MVVKKKAKKTSTSKRLARKKGVLVVKGLTMRYRAELPLVLDNISFQVPIGTKVAVVGRTGSGKSSLASALTRLYPLDSGEIWLNGTRLDLLAPTEAR